MSLNKNLGVITEHVWEDAHVVLLARVTDRPTSPTAEGTAIVQADISSLLLNAFDVETDEDTPIVGFSDLALTIASVWFNAMQGWHVDTTGCNFIYALAPEALPTGDHTTRIEITITLTNGRKGKIVWDLADRNLLKS